MTKIMSARSMAILQDVFAMKLGANGIQCFFPRDHASDTGEHEKMMVNSIAMANAAIIARRA
ncbi:MAG: hypothetical protein CL912_16610 [Deltaproteobacteria bacterium]|nr:hypothetical protein [Deltaproteobacteria bacterium]|tara:strand:- start:776 stop:961 length:186 start_codon:yes stop_codon:yes gene_type:complete